MKVAVVDDSISVLAQIESIFKDSKNLILESFRSPIQARNVCGEVTFDAVLVDFMMPELDGIELIRSLRNLDSYRNVPIVMLTSALDRDVKIRAIEAGATDFLLKPFDPTELTARLRNLLQLRDAQLRLEERASELEVNFQAAARDVVAREEEIIWRLALAVEYRDGQTGSHISRVAEISRLIALELGFDAQRAHMLYLAAPLHDIGKIGIADNILSKPGALTPEEISEMRRHVEIGVKILENGTSDLVKVACLVTAGHHEKWDGTGYPHGVAGEAIPIEARIVAVADVFEALCSERPYKRAWPLDEARAEIIAGRGKQFDPACVDAFERRWSEIVKIMGNPSASDADEAQRREIGLAV
ncbi:HD domain-containing phosphohydrolase [Ciceribacter sp. L1K22]|uniref:HD domain-containing phosphohydrolase n=1 Tax=Ciceribacter sp. L1K22 TaxID=2820275 RepID=UPI001ABDD394|nr:HD domain-containing phosphohydrolase [Ciceribacter sp. L1K22]MBO3762320.1 response regulator [Ciceribacter sp. L1K22]